MWWVRRDDPAGLRPRGTRGFLALALGLAAGLSAGCTVRPLYADLDPTAAYASGASTSVGAALSEIVIPPVNTRPAQELRNELIFLLGGGRGQPASPRYSLGLTVILLDEASASIQNGTDEEPTAATITMTADYVLTDAATGQRLARGRRQVLASYDVPRQEFAALRARRDAEDRAARELANFLRLALAEDLSQIEPARAAK
ncbi:MAG TPA: LPS assembly lipoprotein LptE [Mesorhizobium sp.]|jgi:LPS-assembly lipoprotein|nr:LPS assembly lipoprotein LptE [Mesorhizobium sp.]